MLNPATAGEARRSTVMARKTYSEEFRRQAVELYRSTPGATLRGIATDLGITRGTLATWVWFPRFSGVSQDWFDLEDQGGRLCCQHRGSTPMSCASGRFGCIGSPSRGRRSGGWVSS